MQLVREKLFLAGEWRDSSGHGRIELVSPATEELLGWTVAASEADIDDAVSGARRALSNPSWSDLSTDARADLMLAFAEELESRADETGALVSAENGMPISLAQPAEGRFPAEVLRYYAHLCRETPREERRSNIAGRGSTLVVRHPVGVVAAITPWNYPQSLAVFKIAPALAAGCSVVLKPADETALDAFQFADAAVAAGVPAGVINVVPGGRAIGAYLVAHPGVDKVAFTGSTAAGRAIGEACGRLLRPVTLELGGKSAAIVLDDADLARLAGRLSAATLQNQGQTCHLSTRILAPRQRYREVVDAVADMARSLSVGDPAEPDTRIGPLVSNRQRERVEGYIAAGRQSGTVVTGGSRPAHLAHGWYIEPTVIKDVDPSSPVAREEIFGPVLAVMPYETLDDAVALANDSDYGLGGTVWTADEERGLEVARRMETGTVGVNAYNIDLGAPFGGTKASGLGRELGPEGLDPYFALKSIYTRS